MRVLIFICLLVLSAPTMGAHALELNLEEAPATSAPDCSQCHELCKKQPDGESIQSLDNWICQQCLSLCLKKSFKPEEPEEFIPSPCPAKPIV